MSCMNFRKKIHGGSCSNDHVPVAYPARTRNLFDGQLTYALMESEFEKLLENAHRLKYQTTNHFNNTTIAVTRNLGGGQTQFRHFEFWAILGVFL